MKSYSILAEVVKTPPLGKLALQPNVANLLSDFADSLFLELTDPFSRQIVLVANFLEGQLVFVVETEPPADDARLDGR